VAVISQPDKPSDRGNKVEYSDVKKYCISKDLPLYQFVKISRDGLVDLKALNPDIMVTAAYGQLLSQEILDIAKYGVINIHASILPKYRGASPIQTAIIKGDSETGVTIMKTEKGLDTGDIIDVVKTPIFENETFGELSDRLAMLGSNLLIDVLDNIENGTAKFIPQEHINATVTTKISKNDCSIIWEKSSREIKSLIHGVNPNPIARTILGADQVKIYRAKLTDITLTDEDKLLTPGTVLPRSSVKNGVFVKTGDGALEILEMQLPGGKILPAKVLANGRKINPYDAFKTDIKIR
jgi:methionyl-tRNA formyltransferase